MRIGISTRIYEAKGYFEHRDGLAQDWAAFVERLGAEPIFIPNSLNDLPRYVASLELTGIILSGGGACPQSTNDYTPDLQQLRNHSEEYLVSYAVQYKVPLIGVCRGFQFLNMYFGGMNESNISELDEIKIDHVGGEHEVLLTQDHWQELAAGESKIRVNSFHDDGIMDNHLSKQLRICAVSNADGGRLVEAFDHQSLPIIGIQWHPERTTSSKRFDQKLFRKYLLRK